MQSAKKRVLSAQVDGETLRRARIIAPQSAGSLEKDSFGRDEREYSI